MREIQDFKVKILDASEGWHCNQCHDAGEIWEFQVQSNIIHLCDRCLNTLGMDISGVQAASHVYGRGTMYDRSEY